MTPPLGGKRSARKRLEPVETWRCDRCGEYFTASERSAWVGLSGTVMCQSCRSWFGAATWNDCPPNCEHAQEAARIAKKRGGPMIYHITP